MHGTIVCKVRERNKGKDVPLYPWLLYNGDDRIQVWNDIPADREDLIRHKGDCLHKRIALGCRVNKRAEELLEKISIEL